nr:hypothetical protein B7L52_06325 [Pectobacterium carotovorum]
MNCSCCTQPLNISLSKFIGTDEYKSCPKCSTTHGLQHVYFQSPQFFGTTPARETENNPDGVQSYCDSCRPPSEKNRPSKVFQLGWGKLNFSHKCMF